MACKSILCAYSGEAARGSGLRHAIKIAKHHDAHLTGVLRHGRALIEQKFGFQVPQSLLSTLMEIDNKQIKEVEERFTNMVSEAGLAGSFEFVDLITEKDGSLSEFARGFDLVVTGVHSNLANEAHMSAYPDMIALRSGRPVLVVPDGYTADGLAERAVVAWDGKRSAARAIGDAMDILSEKVSVTLLTVGDELRGTERMVRNMERHGITVEAKSVKRQGSIANTLISHAKEADARLIVMGAYEHSKFSHDLIGGVTTDVIRDTPVPVFMAH
ncbi:universal stress protein [Roseibium sp. MMSF_3544]|uniref:universal stress protein n=1 Tax=unclassified Roseibium TaxID=2629323 RepID=UPI00273FF88E|nr:universal stress protein [Roseibium sp. MMSF_3544]